MSYTINWKEKTIDYACHCGMLHILHFNNSNLPTVHCLCGINVTFEITSNLTAEHEGDRLSNGVSGYWAGREK